MSNIVQLANISRPEETYKLKCLEGGEVVLFKKMIVQDTRAMSNFKTDDEFEKGIMVLVRGIKEWNITGQDGNVAPITVDTISQLWQDDVLEMMSIVTGKDLTGVTDEKDEKKKE